MKVVTFAVQVAAMLSLACSSAFAQWVNVPPAAIPKGPDGKPNLAAPAPRSGGKPDLSGVWEPLSLKYLRDLAADLKPEDVPYQPWAKALVEQRADGSHAKEEPDANCLPQSIPKIAAAPAPWRIVQTPRFVAILYESFTLWRQVFVDGRQFADDLNPSWLGYSVGKWEGDTLVVESRGFNGKPWLDVKGKPTTEALHITERFRRKNVGTLEVQYTIDDTGAYTKPWTITQEFRLVTNTELLEFICNENNRAVEYLPGADFK